jgi:hypothetical protein
MCDQPCSTRDEWIKPKAGDDRAAEPVLGLGENSPEKVPEVSAIEPVSAKALEKALVLAVPSGKSSPAKCSLRCGFLRPVSSLSHPRSLSSLLGSFESSSSREVSSVSEEVMPEMDPDFVPVPGVATRLPSPEKGMLWWGFLL